MSKHTKNRPSQKSRRSGPRGPSLVVTIAIAGMTLIGLVLGEAIFPVGPHPAHWGIALLGGVIGWVVGSVYFKFKGDII